jgi:hypothetical protein
MTASSRSDFVAFHCLFFPLRYRAVRASRLNEDGFIPATRQASAKERPPLISRNAVKAFWLTGDLLRDVRRDGSRFRPALCLIFGTRRERIDRCCFRPRLLRVRPEDACFGRLRVLRVFRARVVALPRLCLIFRSVTTPKL